MICTPAPATHSGRRCFKEHCMKLVFLDKKSLGENADLSAFEEFGELTAYETTSSSEVYERVADADIILTNKVVIDESVMKAAPHLKYVGLSATGVNNVDVKYAGRNNIAVCNVKGYCTDAVAQHTFALLFMVMEQMGHHDRYIKTGMYSPDNLYNWLDRPFMELSGKTWGIIGLGDIGRKVAAVAKAFGCNVIYYSTSGKNNDSEYERVDFDGLLSRSDIVSVHAPLNECTRGLINRDALAKMKKTAYLINVGRGPIVVEKDLAEALDGGLIAGAGLDVFEIEPMKPECPLLHIKNPDRLAVTPHIAWASIEARRRVIDEMCLNIRSYSEGGRRNRVD